jgi:hypothetical protein
MVYNVVDSDLHGSGLIEVLDVLIGGSEGFSCSLDVLHGGLGINVFAKSK